MKYRALFKDKIFEVQADSELGAQEAAFAKFIATLSPSDFTVWITDEKDEWREIE